MRAIRRCLGPGLGLVFAAISMLRPTQAGAQFSNADFVNVQAGAFRARCDGRTDDYAALQKAIDAACTNRQALYVPPGSGTNHVCLHSKPLVARCGLLMFGNVANSHLGSSSLRPLDYAGPDLLIESPGISGITTGPPLVGDSGASYKIDPGNAVTINLRQTATAELDGLTAFTAEGAFRLAAGALSATIVASDGGLSKNGGALPAPNTQDMTLWVNGGRLIGRLRVQGVPHELGYGPVTANVTHYAALTYDGSAVELYYDGKKVGSQPASGPVTQDVTDDVTIGMMNQTGPEGMMVIGSDAGTLIDSVRLSNVARYRGRLMPVPIREFTRDPQTIALVNFDENTPVGFTEVEQGAYGKFPARIFSVVERTKDPKGNGVPFDAGVYVHDLWLQGGLWCWFCTFGSRFDNLMFEDAYVGLVLAGNSNEDMVNSLCVRKGGPPMRYGLLMTSANGNSVRGAQIDTSVFPLVIQSAARTWLSDLLITPQEYSRYGVLTYGAAPSFRGLYFDEEIAKPLGFVGSLVEVANWSAGEVSGLEIDNFSTPGARPIVVDGSNQGYGLTITAGYTGDSGAQPAVTINGSLSSPVILNNLRHVGAGPLSNNREETIELGSDGFAGGGVATSSRVANSGEVGALDGVAPVLARTTPTVENCGSGSNLTSGSRADAFEARAGTDTGSCVIDFASANGQRPLCSCNDETRAAALRLISTPGSLAISNLSPSDMFMCNCTWH